MLGVSNSSGWKRSHTATLLKWNPRKARGGGAGNSCRQISSIRLAVPLLDFGPTSFLRASFRLIALKNLPRGMSSLLFDATNHQTSNQGDASPYHYEWF